MEGDFLINLLVQNELSKTGFVVLDVDIVDETRRLQQFINDSNRPSLPHFNYSLLECSYEENKVILRTFHEILHGFYTRNFTNYRTLNESYLIKPAGYPEELLLHQDWCYTDETQFVAYNIWIPLSDVKEINGGMFFLPGSHLWFNNCRSATLPTSRISISNFPGHQVSKVELKRGQVLLFHPAIFHGSYPNLTDQNRVIVTATVMPFQAPFLYYNKVEGTNEMDVYLLKEDSYLDSLNKIAMGAKPGAPIVKRLNYLHHIITPKELLEMSAGKNILQN